MKEKLDELFGFNPPAPKPADTPHTAQEAVPVEQVPDEFEPETPPDPEADPVEIDPFTREIQAMLEASGVDVALERRRKYSPTSGDIQTHDWESQRERIFSDEPYKFRCKRCLKWVVMKGDQTFGQALEELGVDPNCAAQVIQDIQTV